jgi:predicted glycoside hydrolase/deacetylase ChbG (UPF0249 family)
MKIIINADDFGFSSSINQGIIDSFKEGLISTTTIMINMPYAKEGVDLWKQNKDLGLGLHINLTVGNPISDIKSIPSLVNNEGIFNYIRDWKNHNFNNEEVYTEVKAQIEKLKSYGAEIDHLDCHHDLMNNEIFRKVFFRLALEYNLPVRSDNDEAKKEAIELGVKTTDLWCHDFFKDNARYQTIIDYIESHKDASSIEFMTHLGYIDEDTRRRTSHLTREEEIEALKELKATGFYDSINLVTYKEL